MPHKHKRRKVEDKSIYDLAPSTRAKPLPTRPGISSNDASKKKKNKQQLSRGGGNKDYKDDDTPREFARLLALQKGVKLPSGLDDGTKKRDTSSTKKRKRGEDVTKTAGQTSSKTDTPAPAKVELPKILPGESLRDFSARVDASLPLATVSTSNAKGRAISRALGIKEKTTLHNKRLQKLIAGWRKEEEKIKERELERADEAELEEDDDDEDGTKREVAQLWSQTQQADKDKKGKKLRAQKRRNAAQGADGVASDSDDDDDPWHKFTAKKLLETKQKSLQDVVQAPPVLKAPSAKFKVIENVPKGNASGPTSQRRREELAKEREKFLQEWRKMKGLKTK